MPLVKHVPLISCGTDLQFIQPGRVLSLGANSFVCSLFSRVLFGAPLKHMPPLRVEVVLSPCLSQAGRETK